MNFSEDFGKHPNPLLLYWLTNNAGGGLGRTNTGGGMSTGAVGMGNLADCLELEDLSKIVEVLEYRKNLHNQPNFTIASGNFLPSSTLQQGARLGLAVCRIARNFSKEDFQQEIADIQNLPDQIRNRYKSSKILQEIFSIPEEFFEGIENNDDALQFLSNKSNNEDLSQLLSQINPVPWATGFLVGGSHLLTNWHVIPTKEIAKQAVAQFNYVKDDIGEVETTIEYEFDTDALFIANSALDYTLVQLRSGFQKKPPGYQMGWIPLVEKEDAIAPGLIFSSESRVKDLFKNKLQEMEKAEPKQEAYFDLKYYRVRQQKLNKQDIYVIWQSPDSYSARQKFASKGQFEELEEQFQRIENNIQEVIPNKLNEVKFTNDFINSQRLGEAVFIIQHPKGRTQEVVLFENKVCNNGLLKNYLRYTADADYGSSGSPVFNAQWELIALHHAAIPNFDRKLPADQPFIKAQQGVRICRIVEDLKRKSSGNPRLQSFIEDFVITEEQLKYPPLPAALQLNGITDCIDMKPTQEAKTFPEFSIEAWVKPDLLSSDTTIFSQVCHEKWYQEFGEDSVFGQYLLLLQLTPDRRVVFSREPLWDLSSSAFPENGLLYPLIQPANLEGQTEQKKHPLDILALPSVDQPKITIDHSNKEKVQALQCILYCLGLFPEDDTYDEIVKNGGDLNKKTVEVISKEFGEATNPESWLPPWILITDNTVTIKSEALGFFKTRGSYLGLGTPREKTKTLAPQLKEHKNHRGLRVQELKYCLESLDWGALDPIVSNDKNSEMTEDPVLNPANDDSRMDDGFDWPDKWTEAETWQNPTRLVQGTGRQVKNTTAYAVRKLQKVYRQSADGIFGSLALAALEQAKSYEVCTREQLPVDEFSHIAVTCGAVKYNAGEEVLEIKIYINGQLANRRSINRQSIGNIHQAILGAKANKLMLNEQVSSYSAYFKGAISEVRLWKTDLSHADILAKMHRRLNTSETHNLDLVGYWRLEEGNSFQRGNSVVCKCYDNLASLLPAIYAPQIRMEVRESSASLSLLTANNFPAIPLPSGLKSSQKIDLQQPIAQSAYLPATKKGLTIEFWVRRQSGNGSIVSGGALGRDQYSIIWRNNKVRLQLYRQGKLTTEVETQQTISSLQWHHVALTLTWDDDAWEVRLYLDGKPQNTVAIQAQVKSLNSRENGKSVIVFIANGFAEGQQTLSLFSTNEKNNEQFHGSIAELRVWPVARSQNQIKVYLGQRLKEEEVTELLGYWRFDGNENFVPQEEYLMKDLVQKEIPENPKWVIPQSKFPKFIDIDDLHPAAQAIVALQNRGLLGSFIDITYLGKQQVFNPNLRMSKQEFSALLINAFGGKPKPDRLKKRVQFKDQADIEKSEYVSDIHYVWQLGLLSGEDETESVLLSETAPDRSFETTLSKLSYSHSVLEIKFVPSQEMRRGQVINALVDSLRGVQGEPSNLADSQSEELLMQFYEEIGASGKVRGWIERKSVAKAIELRIIGNEEKLRLGEPATRAEIAMMLHNALKALGAL